MDGTSQDDAEASTRSMRSACPAPAGSAFDPTLSLGRTISPLLPVDGAPAQPPTSPASSPSSGYERIRLIGTGGMGEVWLARQPGLDREVALKSILAGRSSADNVASFMAEAVANGRLDHPNIVPVHDLGGLPDDPFLVMKLVGGRPWSRLLRPGSENDRAAAQLLTTDDHLRWFGLVCDAIAYAHSRQLVHRDLKPANVMIGAYGEVLVMDWGLAIDIGPDPLAAGRVPHRSQCRGPSGTPVYMAPEQLAADGGGIGPWTDVYLLGGILHEILVGRPPHRGTTTHEVLAAVRAAAPPELPANIPAGLAAICRRCLAAEPAERYASASVLREVLEAWQRGRVAEELVVRGGAVSAAAGDDYAAHQEALALLRQAVGAAPSVLSATRTVAVERYATVALGRGDIDLASSLLAEAPASSPQLGARVAAARAERVGRVRRLRRLRTTVWMSVAAIVILLGSGIVLTTIQNRHITRVQAAEAQARVAAEQQRAEAIAQRQEAETQRGQAEAGRSEALAQRKEAERQRGLAEAGQGEAQQQRSAAELQRQEAERQRDNAQVARRRAQAALDLIQEALASADPFTVGAARDVAGAEVPISTVLRQIVANAGTALADSPAAQADVLLTAARGLQRIGELNETDTVAKCAAEAADRAELPVLAWRARAFGALVWAQRGNTEEAQRFARILLECRPVELNDSYDQDVFMLRLIVAAGQGSAAIRHLQTEVDAAGHGATPAAYFAAGMLEERLQAEGDVPGAEVAAGELVRRSVRCFGPDHVTTHLALVKRIEGSHRRLCENDFIEVNAMIAVAEAAAGRGSALAGFSRCRAADLLLRYGADPGDVDPKQLPFVAAYHLAIAQLRAVWDISDRLESPVLTQALRRRVLDSMQGMQRQMQPLLAESIAGAAFMGRQDVRVFFLGFHELCRTVVSDRDSGTLVAAIAATVAYYQAGYLAEAEGLLAGQVAASRGAPIRPRTWVQACMVLGGLRIDRGLALDGLPDIGEGLALSRKNGFPIPDVLATQPGLRLAIERAQHSGRRPAFRESQHALALAETLAAVGASAEAGQCRAWARP